MTLTSNGTQTAVKSGKQRSNIKNRKAWIIGWAPLVLGLVTWVASPFNPPNWSPKILGIFTALGISVIIHEIAHFVTARLLGLKPWALRIGHGEIVFHKHFRTFQFILKSLPYSGAVYPIVSGSRPRRFAMVLAGPLSNVILLMVFFLFTLQSNESTDFDAIPMQMFLANVYIVLVTLIPRSSGTSTNDAMMMLRLLRKKSSQIDSNQSARSKSSSWSAVMNEMPPEALLVQMRSQLGDPARSLEQRCASLDTFATCVLMYGTHEFLAEADRYSEELLRLKPDEWTVKATRGSVLIEKGDLSAGITMLQNVMTHDSDPFDRAISASFLALAELKQNNLPEARKWITRAREVDSSCISAVRIASLLRSQTPPVRG